MNVTEIEGLGWKISLLLVLLAVVLAYSTPKLMQAGEYARFNSASSSIGMLGIPTLTMLCFLTLGWQAALIVALVGEFSWRQFVSHWVDTKFPDIPRRKRPRPRIVVNFMVAAFTLYVIVTNGQDLLRFFTYFLLLKLPFAFFDEKFAQRKTEGGLSGPARVAMRIGFALLLGFVVVASEFIWRLGSFEVWWWFYSYFAVISLLFMATIITPIVIWVDAGEPGLRDP